MRAYKYRARNAEGAELSGRMRATNVAEVRADLVDRDLVVDLIEEKPSIFTRQIGGGKVKRDEIMHLSRQLAAFVRTGVPLLDALEVIAEESSNPAMHRTLRAVTESLRNGWTFSDALESHPKVFPPFLVAAVRSAELTGRLDGVLEQASKYLERDLESRRKVRGALTYPAVILGLSVVTVIVLSGIVLPRFRSFFESFDAELPLSTRILLGVAGFMGTWWAPIMVVLVGSVVGLVRWSRSPAGRGFIDRVLLRLPVVGKITRYAIAERFCRMLSGMVSAGVPLTEAMTATAEGSGNAVYEKGLLGAREEMIRGDGFARPLIRTGLFPGALNQIVRVGEDTGSLDTQLESAAAYYELELDFAIKRMTTMFEPAAILSMAFIVGFVALAMVQAMYGVLQQAGAL